MTTLREWATFRKPTYIAPRMIYVAPEPTPESELTFVLWDDACGCYPVPAGALIELGDEAWLASVLYDLDFHLDEMIKYVLELNEED